MSTSLLEPAVAYRGWPVQLILTPQPTIVAPGRKTVTWEWRDRAACKDVTASALFPHDGETIRNAAARLRPTAERYCAGCAVFETCRREADPYGLWGGALHHRGARTPLIPRAQR